MVRLVHRLMLVLSSALIISSSGHAQFSQADYTPTNGGGLTLNLSAGTAFCGGTVVSYSGGTRTMADNTGNYVTNYVFLDPGSNCAPNSNTTGFGPGQTPIATVVTHQGSITSISDVRNWSVTTPCKFSSFGAVNCVSLGNSQNVTLTPSGTGSVSITGGKLTSDGALTLTAGGTGDKDITLTPNGTGNVLVPRLNKIRFASQFQGADLGAKINAASSDAGPNALIYVDTPGLISTTLSLAAGTVLQFYPGGYHWQVGSTVYANNVKIRGAGPSATIFSVDKDDNDPNNHSTIDLFVINGNRFELSGMQVMPASGVTRGGGSVLNVGTGSVGLVANCRFTDVWNGVTRTNPAADNWTFRDIRADSSGGNWNYLFYFSGSATATLAGTHLDNITVDFRQSNSGAGPSDSVLIIDPGIDTLEAVYFLVMTTTHPAISVRYTPGGGVKPRWIRFVNSYVESGWVAEGISISGTTDLRYQGYIASSQRGAVIGANAVGVDLSHTAFENISREAVSIESGAVGTTLADDTFENTATGTVGPASSASRANNTVTMTFPGPHGLSSGENNITVSGCTEGSYDTFNGGPFGPITVSDSKTITYTQSGDNASDVTGCLVTEPDPHASSISVAAGASTFSIRGNKFRDLAVGKPHYNVVIATGASNNFEVTENQFGAPAIGYFYNGAAGTTGSAWTVLGNSPASGTLLDVAGSAGRFQVSSSGAVLAFTRNNANYIQAATTGGWLDFVVNGRTVGDVNASLKLAPSGDAYFPLGKVGIGTTSPGQKLDVAGSIGSAVNSVTPSLSSNPPACDPMTFDASLGNTQKTTLTCNATSTTLSSASAGEQINFLVCQDGTGSRTFAWPSNVEGGMTIGSTAWKCNAQSFIFDGANAYALSPGVTNM